MSETIAKTRKAVSAYAKRLCLGRKDVEWAMEYAEAALAEGSKHSRQYEACTFLAQAFGGATVLHRDGRRETPYVRYLQPRVVAYWIKQVKTIGRRATLDAQQSVLCDCLGLMDGDDVSRVAQVLRFYAPAYFSALAGVQQLDVQIEVIDNLDWEAVAESVIEQWRQVQARVEARHGREGRRLKRRQRKACKARAA